MHNQMMAHGGLQTALKSSLDSLEIGGNTKLINSSFTRADIQGCCDIELPAKKFEVSSLCIEGGTTIRFIKRIS